MEQSVGRSERKTRTARLHVAEMRMLRWIRGKTRKDYVKNQIIQEEAVLEDDDKDWPTKKWRWSLKVRKVRTVERKRRKTKGTKESANTIGGSTERIKSNAQRRSRSLLFITIFGIYHATSSGISSSFGKAWTHIEA